MQDAKARHPKSDKPFGIPFAALFTTAILVTGGITAYSLWQSSQTKVATNPAPTVPQIQTVTALGRLEPSGEVWQVSASSSAGSDRVAELLVQEGESVTQGQVIAILDSHDRAAADLKQSQEQVRVAKANLARVKAGAKTGEIEAQQAAIARIEAERSNNIAAQQATIAKLEAELRNAQVEYQRHQQLYDRGAISASERDSKELAGETAQQQFEEAQANLTRIRSAQQQQINEAQATLNQIAEVRPVDIEVAAAEVREAQAAVAIAQAELELTSVKAPQTGRILDILTRPGEIVSSDGIARIGKTNQMYAVAEVYESDIGKVKIGQPVNVTSNALLEELHGTVEGIGLEIQRQEVINIDPTANIDAKVVEVRVRLDEESSQKVAGLTNLLVNVKIIL
ncbi:MAG: ABC exporter membrane fusion protein [Pleurocapsa sp. MO_226.B13]|nr:ABC exporter membrane fusion protein [Pleurocapsa sp. MO_226.B13]